MKTKEGYKLIPMSEITDEAREIAVAWMECEDKNWIGQKHKLASDIINYSKKKEQQTRDEMLLFMEWTKDALNIVFNVNYGKYFWTDDITEYTTQEVFEYWQLNIKNK